MRHTCSATCRSLCLATCLVWAAGSDSAAAQDPTAAARGRQPMPVYEEPKHEMVFHHALVRLLDVKIPAGASTEFHVHEKPFVGIAVEAARSWGQTLGSRRGPVEAPLEVPSVFDNWERTLPYTHRVANVDSRPIHYIVAEFLSSSGIDAAPLPEDAMRQLVREGRTVRVYEVTIPGHGATAEHMHPAPGLTVLATAGTLVDEGAQLEGAGGAGRGEWSWRGPGHRHVLRNGGESPLTVFEIDWR